MIAIICSNHDLSFLVLPEIVQVIRVRKVSLTFRSSVSVEKVHTVFEVRSSEFGLLRRFEVWFWRTYVVRTQGLGS